VKRKRFSRKFQRMAVERMRSSDNIGDLAKELGVDPASASERPLRGNLEEGHIDCLLDYWLYNSINRLMAVFDRPIRSQ